MKRISLLFFGLIVLGEMISIFTEIKELHWVCKPLLMISLGLYYFSSSKQTGYFSQSVGLALFFSFLGDVLLMGKGESFFMMGLISFLFAHLFYIGAFRKHRWIQPQGEMVGLHRVRMAFPVVLAASGMVFILYPTLGSYKIPVFMYTTAITLMVLNALFRYGFTSAGSFTLTFLGSILFFISDGVLALDRFYNPVPWADFWIMASYVLGQGLIVEGLLNHGKKKSNKVNPL